MKGIILAGGTGSRLHPLTIPVSKQLLPVYDKPMVYYPLSLLLLAGIREILLISTPADLPLFKKLLGNGSRFGVSLDYAEQSSPGGIAQALLIGERFCDNEPMALALGDNILYGQGMVEILQEAARLRDGGLIFAHYVSDPSQYGVVEFDDGGNAVSLEEKPKQPKSHYAVPGVYFYGPDACCLARALSPGIRGELEITDLNRLYLEQKRLRVKILGRGIAWLDTGTNRSLMDASMFVQAIEERQGLKIACLEEIALRQGWIDKESIRQTCSEMGVSAYATYLRGFIGP